MRFRRVVLIGAVASLLAVDSARAQNAQLLYDAGAYRLAGDSFAARAAREPGVAGHWYNLGNALYHVGDDAGARAAWVRAARISPRNSNVRAVLNLVPVPDAGSAEVTQVPVVTPGELLMVAAILWAIGWGLVALRWRARPIMVVLVVAGVFGAMGWSKARTYQRPVALVRNDNTPLRAAPFASATTRRTMNEGTAVEVLRAYAGWVLVVRGNDRGWMQGTEIVPIAPLRSSGA